ncbi:3H domain-containing protein [Laedolimicola intestinihominis]|uniref:3H domain-containing protein n=1 Tax=Laedolimicola intestinihominis TaxID=3133166 RepID=A0ABV1FGS7_9FIRM
MTTAQRRTEILQILKKAAAPVAAKELAARFGVSRQVIVQDMAVIRVSTPCILSTTRGYVLQQDNGSSREFKVCHAPEQIEDEMNLIVDCGGHIKNISISHRLYGRISADMDVRSRQDVREFVETLKNSSSSVLSNATSGYHYHLVAADTPERLDMIQQKLREAGFLAPLQPWEQEG